MISNCNHVKFADFVLLATGKKQKHDLHFFVQCIIKQLLASAFVISRMIKSYQPQPSASTGKP